ncbi:alpha/beta hydrolase [Saccharomonospora iraqiensis]|uniref:alpha/beta hydrolase n=1 Tax=Saccharomonospora iraqiensis TaxID=52698 RepID=UPI001376C1BC|nr:alpha/beta hydrolase [Saccharomonospora iraqiensis]
MADAVTGVGNAVREIESLAAAHQFLVTEGGDVLEAYCGTEPVAEEVRVERDRIRAELVDRVEQCLRQADDLDADLAGVLRTAAAGETVSADGESTEPSSLGAWANTGELAGSLSIVAPPPPGAAPTDNAGWWAALSPAQRAKLIETNPELVGNRDGVPAEDRSRANLRLVGEQRVDLNQRAETIRDQLAGLGGPGSRLDESILRGELDRIEAKLRSLTAVDEIMHDRHGNPDPDKQLMSLDLTGDKAKAAIANGDVDTADHVAVFTPGMNATVDGSLGGYVRDTAELQRHAQVELLKQERGDESVATVTWLGYEPPQTGQSGTWSDIVTGSEAEDGGEKLARFYNGIDAARSTDPHLTALGHSYGSLTTGDALNNHVTGVDEAGFFGSPGIGVDSTDELNLPEGHAYVWEARDDPVADIGNMTGHHGLDPAGLNDVHHMSTEEYRTPSGDRTVASTGHSEYLTGDGQYQTSEYGMSRVIIGSPDLRLNPAG